MNKYFYSKMIIIVIYIQIGTFQLFLIDLLSITKLILNYFSVKGYSNTVLA